MSDDIWEVAFDEPNDRTNPDAGTVPVSSRCASEAAARSALAETLQKARSLRYTNVRLRHNGKVVDAE